MIYANGFFFTTPHFFLLFEDRVGENIRSDSEFALVSFLSHPDDLKRRRTFMAFRREPRSEAARNTFELSL